MYVLQLLEKINMSLYSATVYPGEGYFSLYKFACENQTCRD